MTKPPLTKLLPNLLPNPLPNQLPRRVTLREVGLRDGLQSFARVMPTAHKLEWIGRAYEAGQREIEVGSFVPARLLPQLADTAELVAFAKTLPGLTVSVLVPNVKGAQRAMECEADMMLLPLSASHAHSLANMRRTPDDVVADIAAIVAARNALGSRTLIEVGMSTAFGCTLQGRVEPSEVLRLLRCVLDAGVDRVGRFDACLAGIGGCPHAPGASGNVATEDLVYMFASMGVKTDIDFDALMALRSQVAHWLDGETLHGTLWRAGLPRTMRPAGAVA